MMVRLKTYEELKPLIYHEDGQYINVRFGLNKEQIQIYNIKALGLTFEAVKDYNGYRVVNSPVFNGYKLECEHCEVLDIPMELFEL